jgi:hypothetical protein
MMNILSIIRENKFLTYQLCFNLFVLIYLIIITIVIKRIFNYQEEKFEHYKNLIKLSKKKKKKIKT